MQIPLTHRSSPSGHGDACAVVRNALLVLLYLKSFSESDVIMISLLSWKLPKRQLNR